MHSHRSLNSGTACRNSQNSKKGFSEMSESAAIPTSLSVDSLSAEVRSYVEKWAEHCKPLSVHVCDGSEEEDKALLQLLQQQGSILPLSKLENW